MRITIKVAKIAPDGYRAWCPALPGCAVWGLTRTEALRRIQEAVDGYVDHIDITLPRELASRLGDETTCDAADLHAA
jgi:predicted RNase H-like HicB family nuclease